MHVYILTIRDQANFQKVEHHSVWSTYLAAEDVKRDLIHRDRHHGLGGPQLTSGVHLVVRGAPRWPDHRNQPKETHMDSNIIEALRIVHTHMEDVGDQPFRLRETDLPPDVATSLVESSYVILGTDGLVDDVADLPERQRAWPDETPIRAVGPNPKRVGTDTHARFELFRTCGTVGAYIDLASRTTSRKQALLDVRWAMERGQIVVDDADAASPSESASALPALAAE